MLREFSAIGMSRYTSQRAMDNLIGEILQNKQIRGYQFLKDGKIHVEIIRDMGPFQMILRGEVAGKNYINIHSAIPAIKEKRGCGLIDCELQEDTGDVLYLTGQERESLEGVCLSVTEVARFFTEASLRGRKQMEVSCYGLSTEGKILLGIERSQEDEEAIHEGENWRREMLSRAMDGDESAIDAIEAEEAITQREIEERLQKEDVYSIFDGFMYPAEMGENCFTMLGDIMHVDKLMNAYTEEWVYYLELDVLGMLMRVSINPRDLLGEPKPGRRFMGKAWLHGRLDPARMILEDHHSFF